MTVLFFFCWASTSAKDVEPLSALPRVRGPVKPLLALPDIKLPTPTHLLYFNDDDNFFFLAINVIFVCIKRIARLRV
jgi:hypothetical protein